MSMRYIIRRNKPEDLTDIKPLIPDVEKQLGAAGENLRRFLRVSMTPLRYAQYTFVTRKTGTGWIWLGTSIELVAEDEKGLFAMTDKFNVPRPEHLKHLA